MQNLEDPVVIVSVARTPFGAFQGGLRSIAAPKLGALVIKQILKTTQIDKAAITEVIMGNVLSAGLGQAPARQAVLEAKLLPTTKAFTVNKVCGSGMQALICAMHLQAKQVAIVGGMENMSLAPYLVKGARSGYKFGHKLLIDSMLHDGLQDPFSGKHMGECAEVSCHALQITRDQHDLYARCSYERANSAWDKGRFSKEVFPVDGCEKDEGVQPVDFAKMQRLKSAFVKEGAITAANASSLSDGAAAMMVMRESHARYLGLKVLAKIVFAASHGTEPQNFALAPARAIEKVAALCRWDLAMIDLFEINEAFALVPLYVENTLGIPRDKINVFGGSIALGHPIGASGARVIITLVSALRALNKTRGIASICIGGGEALAVALEREKDG